MLAEGYKPLLLSPRNLDIAWQKPDAYLNDTSLTQVRMSLHCSLLNIYNGLDPESSLKKQDTFLFVQWMEQQNSNSCCQGLIKGTAPQAILKAEF